MKDGIDFIGVNHYATLYAKDCIHSICSLSGSRAILGFVDASKERDGIPIGAPVCMICVKYPFCPSFTITFFFVCFIV